MSLYASDFKTSTIRSDVFESIKEEFVDFNVIITTDKIIDDALPADSIIRATKPILYFSTLFGLPMIKLSNHSVKEINIYSKIYSSCVIVAIITLLTLVKPISWNDTQADIPLYIVTILFTLLHYTEVFFILTSVSFYKSQYYTKLFKVFDDLLIHFKNRKVTFHKIRLLSVIFTIIPTVQFMCTFFLRKFNIANIGVHLTVFVVFIQGSVLYFFVLSFYSGQKIFNINLERKMPQRKKCYEINPQEGHDLQKKSLFFFQDIFSHKVDVIPHPQCWLELMQMYDKIADSVYIFNKIYSWQVLLMFTTWLACTMLTICRSLSPSLNYKEIYRSDLFIYTCINARPFFLGVMCEMIVKEWRKTRDILIHIMIHGDLDDAYFQQVQTMLDLVETRRLEVSANVFLVNIPIITDFAGKAISYTVLMIQYFYMHML